MIDEYARRPRRVVWFRPACALIRAPQDKRIAMGVGAAELRRKNKDRRGNSFCQVDRIMHRGQERPVMTFGNQKWVGAAPSFVISPRSRSHLGSRG